MQIRYVIFLLLDRTVEYVTLCDKPFFSLIDAYGMPDMFTRKSPAMYIPSYVASEVYGWESRQPLAGSGPTRASSPRFQKKLPNTTNRDNSSNL